VQLDQANDKMGNLVVASRLFWVRVCTVTGILLQLAFTIACLVFLFREVDSDVFIDFMGYGYFFLFGFLAISLIFFSTKLIRTLERLKGGKSATENSHEVLLKRMIIIFTITYTVRALYNCMQGHYYLFIPSYFSR